MSQGTTFSRADEFVLMFSSPFRDGTVFYPHTFENGECGAVAHNCLAFVGNCGMRKQAQREQSIQ
jgi:hypothetical protein